MELVSDVEYIFLKSDKIFKIKNNDKLSKLKIVRLLRALLEHRLQNPFVLGTFIFEKVDKKVYKVIKNEYQFIMIASFLTALKEYKPESLKNLTTFDGDLSKEIEFIQRCLSKLSKKQIDTIYKNFSNSLFWACVSKDIKECEGMYEEMFVAEKLVRDCCR